ncbi:hypothetical protein XELAEV_18002909mg [Xenopus laevis]|uniref:Uncharacterized protein n=1 Tax=Xenopus laevis TaxID=8355 RepID=A0A974BNL0_XENLA|nr:hypothetical protein XELAEV_18002909mg [Xenopus laevis]
MYVILLVTLERSTSKHFPGNIAGFDIISHVWYTNKVLVEERRPQLYAKPKEFWEEKPRILYYGCYSKANKY